VPYKGIYDINGIKSLKEIVEKHKIKTVYATLELASIVARLLKMHVSGLNVVRRESGTGVVDRKNRPNFKLKKFKLIDMVLNLWVDKIIVLSEEMKELASKYQPWHKHKITVIGNGVNITDDESVVK